MEDHDFRKFESWDEVLAFVDRFGALYYHAPLDARPVRVEVSRRGRGRKVRVRPPTRDVDPFWADEGHLDRFFTLARRAS